MLDKRMYLDMEVVEKGSMAKYKRFRVFLKCKVQANKTNSKKLLKKMMI